MPTLNELPNLQHVVHLMGFDNGSVTMFDVGAEKHLKDFVNAELEQAANFARHTYMFNALTAEEVAQAGHSFDEVCETVAEQLTSGDAAINDILVAKDKDWKLLQEFLDAVFHDPDDGIDPDHYPRIPEE